MDVVIAGGHGQIALLLERTLVDRGDRVRGLIRNPEHVDDLREAGAEPVLCDLEAADVPTLTEAIAGADAVVFAAGAGPGSGEARKATMDRDGAVKLLEAARAAGVGRYVMVSAMGAAAPPEGGGVFGAYLRAKAEADAALQASELAWTIVRPGALTDAAATGAVQVAVPEVPRGEVSRADVAAVLVAVLDRPESAGLVFGLTAGEEPVGAAIDRLAASR